MMRFNQCGEEEKFLREHIKEHKALLERLPDGDNHSPQYWRKKYIKDLIETRENTLNRLLSL